MVNHNHILNEIERIQRYLIEKGYAVRAKFLNAKQIARDSFNIEIDLGDGQFLSEANDCLSYEELYFFYLQKEIYICQFLDGALLQIDYSIREGKLWSYRLGFFPHPRLAAQDFSPEFYNSDDLFFIDVINKPVIHPVLRFDFDNDPENFRPCIHSRSHLTIGQLDSCRITVNRPLTPFKFLHFILKNFYSTLFNTIEEDFSSRCRHHQLSFEECIEPDERHDLHMVF
ncbi:DUF2290 domain-containing protein [Acinetobacter pittii]|uniref:DUF2290 domain-containing protein n=1 Tax=Acinetobacter pittii TaxID=48296 RepID=UPI00083E0D8D|nr:DUF2290 domain-containing protein [Acinetobacter pittii]MCU4432004.1 DUF2290 domain-containing protein [Acinetobacter pittii]MCU4533594.1 DUF2290 domain-containing protein [Acinetobacter pittii]ODI93549.1 hypothetical protein BFR91_11180 [Acinetobacter pittii]